jgi:type VI secretion system ImpM family protein
MTQTVQAQIAYFGKIPSRGDFVKSAHNPQLLATLDRWIAEAMEDRLRKRQADALRVPRVAQQAGDRRPYDGEP